MAAMTLTPQGSAMVAAVWPNGLRTRPTLSSLWKEYDGVYAKDHWGFDSYGYTYNHAIAAGVIVKIGYNSFGGGGHEVYLKLDGSGDIILYYHNADGLLVEVGDHVVAGQRLGIQSDSGKTDGIHLHLEVWLKGYRSRRTNPLPYITKLVGTSPAGGGGTPIEEIEEEEMTAIRIRDAGNGSIAWATIGTGHFWELPGPDYEALLDGWGLWDRTKDMDVPSNLYGFLKGVAIQSRGSVDAKAVAAAVVASIPLGQIDPTALTAAIETALGDNFAAIPGAVVAEMKLPGN